MYAEFDPKVHVVPRFDIPRDWPVWDGIDPHLRKPHAYCQWAISPDGDIYVVNELYEACTINQLADKILELRRGKNVVCTLIDTSSEAPDAVHRLTPRRMLERSSCGCWRN